MTTYELEAKVSAVFRREYESHSQRGSDPALALDTAREIAAKAIPFGVTGNFDDATLEFVCDGDDDLTECAYCNRTVSDGDLVPAVDDDEEWTRLATDHAPDCEWIVTRAHRVDPAA